MIGHWRDVCSRCGSHRYYAGYWIAHAREVHPRLRCDCPQPGSGWEHPEALAWREDDERLVREGYSPLHQRREAA